MFAADETTSFNDAGACPACGHNDCWLGCPEAEAEAEAEADTEADTDDDLDELADLDQYDTSGAISADAVRIGDRIDGHTVYDIAPSALDPQRLIVAVARNGAASAYSFERNEQITVER